MRAAREAQPGWEALSPRERGTLLLAVADLIADRAEELTRLETLDVGKPLHEARVEVHHAERLFRFCWGIGSGVELPFGGIRQSGFGREKALRALTEYSALRTTTVRVDPGR